MGRTAVGNKMVHFDVIYMHMYYIFGAVILGQHKRLNAVIYIYIQAVCVRTVAGYYYGTSYCHLGITT